MNTTTKLKSLLAGAVAAVGLMATAETTVKVDKVETGDPWSTITVNYTLGGVDAETDYKVAFDVTANGTTASCTNEAAKLTDGATTKEIDTAALFGAATPDTKAKVKVSLIALKPKQTGVQLWEGGPYFATCNVGATKPEEYGNLYKFNDDEAKNAAESLGSGWRLPTADELRYLIDNSHCKGQWTTQNSVNGYLITGVTAGYTDKSIFLPAAGYDYGNGRGHVGDEGYYWSSEAYDDSRAWYLNFFEIDAGVLDDDRGFGLSVRAVR